MDEHKIGYVSRVLTVALMIFLLFPLLAVVPVSFTSKRYLSMPEGHWSLRHYEALFSNPDWVSSIQQSLVIALSSGLAATVLAVSFGIGIWYTRSRRLKVILVGVALIPMAIPPVISAMVMYFMETKLGSLFPDGGYDTLTGVAIAHVIMIAPYGVVTMLVALSQLDRRIELAARNLGASLWQTTFLVVLPNLKLAVASTLFLTFALSWEEVSVTLFITSVNVNTVPRHIWTDLRDNISPSVAAISVLLLSITIVVLVSRMLIQRLTARRLSGN